MEYPETGMPQSPAQFSSRHGPLSSPPIGILPEDFDGTFRFTNPTTEDFVHTYNGKNYTYPAMRTTPMIIVDATPLEIQSIRRKAARKLAEREFFKSAAIKKMTNKPGELNSIFQAGVYSDSDLEPWIRRCLMPLEIGRATITDSPKEDIEKSLRRDEDGELLTQPVDRKVSSAKELSRSRGK